MATMNTLYIAHSSMYTNEEKEGTYYGLPWQQWLSERDKM